MNIFISTDCPSFWNEFSASNSNLIIHRPIWGKILEEGYGDYTEVELGKNRMALLTCSMASDLEEYIEKAKK